MKHFGLASNGAERRRVRMITDYQFHKGEWMETNEDPVLSPTVFLVEQPPNATLYSHWHGENQFQVMVQGSGSIGKEQLRPFTVHYAGAYTGYGPIVSGDEGLSYFTIRSVFEVGSMRTMDKMVRGPKRHAVAGPHVELDAAALKAITSVETIELIPLAADGLCTTVIRVPPNGSASGLDPATGYGQFYMVLQGGLDCDGRTLRRLETVFLSPDEKPMEIRANDEGVEVLFLQLPPKEPVYAAAKEEAMRTAAATPPTMAA